MTAPKATSLFHFTKNSDVLKSILKNGFYPFYSLEDLRWSRTSEYEFVAFPLVAFCDIPLGRITDHVGFYGRYGLGLSRGWGLANGLNPLVYLAESGPFRQAYCNTMWNLHQRAKEAGLEDHLDDVRYLIGFAKALRGTMIVGGTPVDKEFYQESEWRFLATHDDIPRILTRPQFEDEDVRRSANEKAKTHCALSFTPADVQYIFVPDDSEIPDLVDFINRELDSYPMVDIKKLTTRILTVTAVEHDT